MIEKYTKTRFFLLHYTKRCLTQLIVIIFKKFITILILAAAVTNVSKETRVRGKFRVSKVVGPCRFLWFQV